MIEQYEISFAIRGKLYVKKVMALSKDKAQQKFLDNHPARSESDIRSVYKVDTRMKKTTHYTYGDLDPLQIFALPVWVQEFIKKYPARGKERAFAKDIPVNDENMAIIDRIAKVIPIIRRWRGSSRYLGSKGPGEEMDMANYYDRPVAYCQKRGAERVSLYYREKL